MEVVNPTGTMELMLVIRVVVTTLLGALMGLEREWHGKDAGIRTHAAVALGACVFGIVSFSAAYVIDPTRIASILDDARPDNDDYGIDIIRCLRFHV